MGLVVGWMLSIDEAHKAFIDFPAEAEGFPFEVLILDAVWAGEEAAEADLEHCAVNGVGDCANGLPIEGPDIDLEGDFVDDGARSRVVIELCVRDEGLVNGSAWECLLDWNVVIGEGGLESGLDLTAKVEEGCSGRIHEDSLLSQSC